MKEHHPKVKTFIMPTLPLPAATAAQAGQVAMLTKVYTYLSSVMNMPAGSLPVTVVTYDENSYSQEGKWNSDKLTKVSQQIMLDS